MNTRQRDEIERALERAQREGLEIVARGYRKADGARVLCVTSGSVAGKAYPVAVLAGRLECCCKARGYCKHRALVHAELKREASTRAQTLAAVEATVARVEASVARMARASAEAARRETALSAAYVAQAQPFSLFKMGGR